MIDQPRILPRKLYKDNRGYFTEQFRRSDWDYDFVQDNLSFSKGGVLRGLHHQRVTPQGKIITVISGEVQDVIVDIRKESDTLGVVNYFNVREGESLWVPPGFLHGFLTLKDTMFMYKCTDYYNPHTEVTVNVFDPDLSIEWKLGKDEVICSEKDLAGMSYKEFISEQE